MVLPMTNDQSEVLQEQMHFCKTLYKSSKHGSPVSQKTLFLLLEHVDKLSCEGKVTQAKETQA